MYLIINTIIITTNSTDAQTREGVGWMGRFRVRGGEGRGGEGRGGVIGKGEGTYYYYGLGEVFLMQRGRRKRHRLRKSEMTKGEKV